MPSTIGALSGIPSPTNKTAEPGEDFEYQLDHNVENGGGGGGGAGGDLVLGSLGFVL